MLFFFFFSSRRRHTRLTCDWSSDVCSSDLVTDEAVAVSSFDENGQGIVSLELDGQVVQILATLQPQDRLLGPRVRAGQRLRIDDVNAARQTCTRSEERRVGKEWRSRGAR